MMMIAVVATTVGAEEQSAGEAAGVGQRLQDIETPPAAICHPCVQGADRWGGAGTTEHGLIIYLEGVFVDYDGLKSLNNLNFIVNHRELRW